MSSTAIIFAKELTRWEDFPGDVPPESKSVWNALPDAVQEQLKPIWQSRASSMEPRFLLSGFITLVLQKP